MHIMLNLSLCADKFENECCDKAALYGILLYGRHFSQTSFIVQTEHDEVLQTASNLLSHLYHIKTEVKSI